MRKSDFNLSLLTVIMATAIVASNVAAERLIDIGIGQIPGGILCYAVTFLVSDVINEIWGETTARKTVVLTIVGQITASALFTITGFIPCADSIKDEAYSALLGNTVWFSVSGLIAYAAAQILDVVIFQKLREKQAKMKWLRNNVSTIISQAADSFIFLLVGFGIGNGWLWNGKLLSLCEMFGVQLLAKVILAVLDTPVFYLLTRKEKGVELLKEKS